MTPAPTPTQPAWTPPPDVTDHAGNPIPPQMDFFLPPPPEIGQVRSAFSDYTAGYIVRPYWIIFALIAAAVFTFFCILLRIHLNAPPFFHFTVTPVVVFISIYVAYALANYAPSLSYVGTHGVAIYKLHGQPYVAQNPKSQLFHFHNAVELRNAATRHYRNGIYTGTHYAFTWNDTQGNIAFKLAGSHSSKADTPKPKHPYWIAQAAELSWSLFLLDALDAQVQTHGFVHFNLAKQDWIRVGPGFFEISMRGQVARITPDQIKSVSLNDGQFGIVSHDAGWFSRAGKFYFSYADVANARLFLLAVEKLAGYRFN